MRFAVFSSLLAALAPSAALAAEEGAAGGDSAPNPAQFQIAPFITTIVLFLVVLWILNKYAWPHILGALKSREEKIRSEIEQAERSRKQAQQALQEYEQALSQARSEAAKILEDAKAEQQKIAQEMRAKTDQEIQAMRESAKRDIESAKRAAISEIYNQMATTATSVASKILQRELRAEDHRDLVEQSLSELETARSN